MELKHEKIITKFYKKLIEGTVNRKKDKEKDKNLTNNISKK